MHIFGVAILLYYLKWSDGSGFWLKYSKKEVVFLSWLTIMKSKLKK